MPARDSLVFLFDVDNTLIDNDRFGADLAERLQREFGAEGRERYQAIDRAIRGEVGYADYLGALQRLRGKDSDKRYMDLSFFLLDYPFDERRFDGVVDAIEHLHTLGRPVIMSDGDTVFQPRKIRRAGLWDLFRGEVLIYVHKEEMLGHMQATYPAEHYVMVDDKPRILVAMKRLLGERVTTVFVKQGHYAVKSEFGDVPPDMTVASVAELETLDREAFPSRTGSAPTLR